MAEREMGTTLILVGVILIVGGLLVPFLPFLCGIGVILLIIGIILAIVGQPRPVYYAAPGMYPYAAPPPAVPCPVCGQPLTWVPQYGRWWCGTCQQYR
ncbi:MAG: hypothetical protein ACT4OI_00840 [Methanobacteriota archaeon]